MSETYTGENRRSIERDGTTFTDKQRKGAAKRVIEEDQTLDGAEFTEGDLMRNAIKEKLGVASAPAVKPEPNPAEFQEAPEFSIEQFVETAYPEAVKSLLDGEKLCEAEQIPSKEEVLAKLKTLSPAKLEVVKGIQIPMLVLEPQGLSYRKFIRNLDTGVTTRNRTEITDSRRKQFDLQDKALGIKGDGKVTDWKFSIMESAEDLDGKVGYLENLTAEWKEGEQAKRGAILVDHTKFALAQKQAVMSGRRLDRINWSVLSRRDNNKETVCKDGLVSGGRYRDYSDGVYFHGNVPDGPCNHARFRVAVTA